MNCERVQQLLSMEQDGRPVGKQAAAVTEHVRDCPACRRFQEALTGFGGKLRTAGEWQPAPRREIRRRALDRWFTEREAASPSKRRPFFLGLPPLVVRPYVLATVAVMILAAMSLVWRQHGRSGMGPTSQIAEKAPRRAMPSPRPQGPTRVNAPPAPPTPLDEHATPDDRRGTSLETGSGSPRRPLPRRPIPAVPQQMRPAPQTPPTPAIPDDQFLDGRDPSLQARWNPVDRRELAQLEAILRKLPPPADDFVRIPLPRIAAAGNPKAAVAAAAREYGQKAKIVDPRLFRKVTVQMKGASLADFCAGLKEQSGIELSASRGVADEKVTVFVKEQPARELMRAVARLFGYAWLRSGEEGAFRYELDQDLKSQLVEEELRIQDSHAALLALDAEMEKYRPYVGMDFAQIEKRWAEHREENRRLWAVGGGGWGGVQLYYRLTPAERSALAAGEEMVLSRDASRPDRRLPLDWSRSLLKSFYGPHGADESISQLRMRLDRSELGQLSLVVRTIHLWKVESGETHSYYDQEIATGRSPSVANPENAKANAAVRDQSPLDQGVTLRPEPSCPAVRRIMRGQEKRLPNGLFSAAIGDLQQPHVFSGDVWEAVHRETGLPIVADYYTRLHRLDQVSASGKSLFDALCTIGDTMGVRWRKEGDFLLCRSTSSRWDKLKEVPNRYLQRWIADRDAHGEQPLSDFLEMASMPDAQMDSAVVSEGITHCWGLHEWELLHLGFYRWARFFSMLTPEQQRRAQSPDRLPLGDLTPEQRRAVMAIQYAQYAEADRQSGGKLTVPADWWSHASFGAEYEPAGWYVWTAPERAYHERFINSPLYGRTAAEALAAARREWVDASMEEVKPLGLGHFSAGIGFTFHN